MYVSALIYLAVRWDISLLSTEDSELSLSDILEKDQQIEYVTGVLILTPFITAFIAFALKAFRDNKNGRSMTLGFYTLLIVNFVHSVALVAILFEFYDNTWAFVALLALSTFFYAFVQYFFRIRYSSRPIKISDKFTIPPYLQTQIWTVLNVVMALIFFTCGIIVAFTLEDATTFESFSVVALVVMVILTMLLIATWVADRTRMDEMPIYHSPWVFPIYKYFPKDNDVEPYSSAVVLFYAVALLGWVWCLFASVEFSPAWYGVNLTCVIEGLTIIVTLYFVNSNNVQYGRLRPYVDKIVIKHAWLDAKENLVRMRNLDSRSEYVSYAKWWRRRHDLRNYLLVWQNKAILSWPET